MISIKNLTHSIEKPILEHLNLELKKGEIQGIVGVSGAGKSTLLNLIAGFLDVQDGEILFEGKKIVGPSYKLVPGYEDIQLVNQNFALDLYHTVRENIRLKAEHLTAKDREELTEELLDLLELKPLENRKAHVISGGEKQRLSLARALAKEPKVLLLDEPFSHLDVHLRSKLMNYLMKLREVRKTSILMVTHNGMEAMAMCDTIHFLHQGKFVRTASPQDFYYHPRNKFEASFFGEINQITLNNKRILFRPNEYQLIGNQSSRVEVEFERAVFQGSYYANYFKVTQRTKVVLYSKTPLENLTEFYLN